MSTLVHLKESDESCHSCAQAATRLDPRNVQAINMLGLCYTSKGDLQASIRTSNINQQAFSNDTETNNCTRPTTAQMRCDYGKAAGQQSATCLIE